MKKFFLVASLVACMASTTNAQQFNARPPFYLYSYNYMLVNPALAGNRNEHVFSALYQTWEKPENFTSIQSSAFISYEERLSSINSGIGVMATNENIGSYTHTSINGFYNYRISMNNNGTFTFGTKISYQRHVADYSLLSETIGYNTDPLLLTGPYSDTDIDADLGIAFMVKNFTLGIAIHNIIAPELTLFERIDNIRNFNFLVSNTFSFDKIVFMPALCYFTNSFDTFGRLDFNGNLELMNTILLGANVRFMKQSEIEYGFNAGLSIMDTFEFMGVVYSDNPSSLKRYEIGLRTRLSKENYSE